MKSALVTGANKSIGFEVARQLAQKGIYVYLGCRNLERGIECFFIIGSIQYRLLLYHVFSMGLLRLC